jgi:hypothetical protein
MSAVSRGAVERAWRHIDTKLELLGLEERALVHALRQATQDVARFAALAQESEACAAAATRALARTTRAIQAPVMRAMDDATVAALEKGQGQGQRQGQRRGHVCRTAAAAAVPQLRH